MPAKRRSACTPTISCAAAARCCSSSSALYNHLHDISAICAGVGFAPGTMAYATLKERAQRLNERLTGHRFLFGHSQRRRELAVARRAATIDHARRELRELAEEHATVWRQLQFVVLAAESSRRCRDAHPPTTPSGSVPSVPWRAPPACARMCAPTARDCPTAASTPVVAQPAKGDVGSRMAQRAVELEQSLALLDELADEAASCRGGDPCYRRGRHRDRRRTTSRALADGPSA